jgi:hypothetical protein
VSGLLRESRRSLAQDEKRSANVEVVGTAGSDFDSPEVTRLQADIHALKSGRQTRRVTLLRTP